MLKEIDPQRPGGQGRLRSALRDGVFLVRSTVPESLLEEAYAFLRAFFALDPDAKHAYRLPGDGQCGYTPPPADHAHQDAEPEWRELFHWGAALPARHPLRVRYPARYPDPCFPDHLVPGIGAALRELHARMLRFQHDVVRTLAGALGAHPDYFADMLQDGPVVNRAAWYPPMDQAPSRHHVWAARHQDLDLLTALPRATAAGLEVLVDGEWLAADAPPGYTVVNVGLVLDRLTNGLARAGVHRVTARPGHREGRLALAQFCHPAPWTALTPLHVPGAGSGPQRFSTLTADEFFQRTVYRLGDPDARPAPAR